MNNRRRMHQRALIMTYPYLRFRPKVKVFKFEDTNCYTSMGWL